MIRNLAADIQAFTSNVFLIEGERTVLVDPGANFDVVSRLEDTVDSLDAIVLTHTHPDHVENTESVASSYEVDVWGYDPQHPYVDEEIDDGDVLQIGDDEYQAVHTPGHKDDHLCFYADNAGILFAGDLVFGGGGFGRTDLEEGDRPTLVRSIQRILDLLDEDLGVLHSGHGPSVTDRPYEDIEMAYRMAQV
ncbi:MAG: MBL fold metallo-hydrolase [Halobacteriota archaeon]